MGPFDQPPMVTAQGYNPQMVGAPTAPVDQTAMIADLLRRRNAAAQQAQMASGNAQMWNSQFQRPQFQQTIQGSNGQPDQVQANWGDILGKGISNYMGAKERKTSIEKNSEVQQINSDFMNTTLSNDPTAQKLYGAVQAGVPGADKALTEHMSPKKEKMAVLVQGLTSGAMAPELAEKLAGVYGLDPGVVRRAAEYAASQKQQTSNDKFASQSALEAQKLQGQKELQDTKPTKTGYTQAELNAMPIEQRIAAVQASSGRESQASKLASKAKFEATQDLPKTDYAIKNLQDVINIASKAAYYPGNLGMVNPKLTQNSNNAMLEQAIDQVVLDEANGKLGGGVSNADVVFLKNAKTNLNSGNRDTVVAQLNKVLTKLQVHRAQMAKQAGSDSPAPSVNTPSSRFDTTITKEMRQSNQPDTFDEDWGAVGGQ